MARAALRSELERLRTLVEAAPEPEQSLPPAHSTAAGGVPALASELARALRRRVEHYKEVYGLSEQDAAARGAERSPAYEETLLKCPPDELTFAGLSALYQRDPECAIRRWHEVLDAAREERQSGHHGARLLEGYCGNSWMRAQFLALRDELAEAWRPRAAQEWLLIDQMAQFQTAMERWQHTLAAYTVLWGGKGPRHDRDEPDLPRVAIAEAVDQAAGLVERMHRLYVRTLKALQDRRRGGPPVVVRRAGQVNVGAQQVNVCGGR